LQQIYKTLSEEMERGKVMKKIVVLALVCLLSLGSSAFAADIVIGNLQDLSGPTSVWGNAVTRGAELAIEKINAAGGINGQKLKLVTMDTKLKVQEAITAYNRLAGPNKAAAIVGPPVSNIGLALASIADSKGVPIVGSFIDPRVTMGEDGKAHKSMFLMQPSSIQFSEILASYAVDKMGMKKIAVFYDQSNAFSVSLTKPFVEYVKKAGGEIVSEQVYTKGDKDFKTQLTKIRDSGAEAFYFPNYIQDAVLMCKQRNQLGMDMPVIGGLDFAPPFASLLNDPEAGDGIYLANNFSEKEPQLVEVRNAYKAKYNEEPINKVYLGYDKILIIAKAMELGGGTSPAQVIDGLNKVKDLQATTGVITLSPDTHQPVGLTLVMYEIKGGEYVEIGRYAPPAQ
jgi:branched-chain amino acid transport system substrate-binding protein